MAKHGFSDAAITAFGRPDVKYWYLVRIDFSTPVYFSLGPHKIDYDGKVFVSDGLITKIPDLVEILKITPTTIALEMSGASNLVHSLTMLDDYRHSDVYIYLHESSTGETGQVFKGQIDSFNSDNDDRKGQSKVIWKVANHWTNWKAKAGRFISYEEQLDLYGVTDFGLFYASIAAVQSSYSHEAWNYARLNQRDVDFHRSVRYKDFNVLEADQSEFKEKLPLVYGTKKVEGYRVFSDFEIVAHGNVDLYDYYWEIWVLAEGECDGLVDVFFDGESYNGSPTMQQYIKINFHGGADNQLADADMVNANFAFDQWTADFRLLGICYLAIRYEQNTALWDASNPPKAPLVKLRGKKLFDPRNGQTFFDSNNAKVLLDYVTNNIYGKGIPLAGLAGVDEGINYAVTQMTEHDGTGAGTIPLFDYNGYVDTDKEIKKNVEDMLFTMRAHLPYVNGEYKLVIDRHDDTGSFVIDADNITGNFKVIDGTVSTLLNEVTYDFVDIDDAGEEIEEQVVVKSDAYLLADGRPLRKSYTNKAEINKYRARNRCNTLLKASREQIQAECSLFNMDAIQVEVGEIVLVNSDISGWVLKEFRVTEYRIKKEEISMKLLEYEPSVYDWDVLPDVGVTTNSGRPSPFAVDPVTSLILLSDDTTLLQQGDKTIVPRIKATFDPPSDIFNLSGYRIYVQASTGLEYLYRTISNPLETELFIDGLQEGVLYLVSVIAFNRFAESTRVSDLEMALGKSADPLPIDGVVTGSVTQNIVNVFWNPSEAGDFDHYNVYAAPDNNKANASLVYQPKNNTVNHPTNVNQWYWVSVVDTSENESTYFPVGSTNGVIGVPDGLTILADWIDIIGKPYDDEIFNVISFMNSFEVESFDLWTAPTGNALTPSADAHSGLYSGLFKSTLINPLTSTITDVTHIQIPERIALGFAGKRIRITVYAKKPATGASASFKMAYSTWGDGNSGWSEAFVPPENVNPFATFSFNYDVPANDQGTTHDYLGIWGDTSGGSNGVLIDNVVIDIIGDWNELAGTDNVYQTFYEVEANEPDDADGVDIGDYWINATDKQLHRCISIGPVVWWPIQDEDISRALQDAFDANANADTKIVTFMQDDIPTATDAGDIWIETDNGNVMYRAFAKDVNWIGSVGWVIAQDDGIALAITNAFIANQDADTAQATADGKVFTFVAATEPTSDGAGDLWMDTSDGNKLYRAFAAGVNWIGVTGWVLVQDDGIGTALTDAANAVITAGDAEALADGKIVTFIGATEPTSISVGDIWMDTSDDNKMYRAFAKGVNWIGPTGWVVYAQETADWDKIFGTNKPANNANVTTAVRIGGKPNYNSFSTANNGDCFIHGFNDEGNAADVNPQIAKDGQNLTLIKGTLDPNMICEGYVVYRPTGWGDDGDLYAIGIPNGSASWSWTMYYKDGGTVQANTVSTNGSDYVIGFCRTNTGDTNINNVSLWGYGIKTNMALDYNADVTNYSDYRVSNSVESDSVLTIKSPVGATYSNDENNGGGTTVTGAIVIVLPQGWVGTMLKFVTDIFLYDGHSFSVSIGGHIPSSAAWLNEFAQISGDISSNNRVRFGYDGSKCVVVIGQISTDAGGATIWNRPKINVRDFQAGYNGYSFSQWDDNWNIKIVTSFTGYSFSGDFSDALLDAASILNQGVLATDDTVNETTIDDESTSVIRTATLATKTITASSSFSDVLTTPSIDSNGEVVLINFNFIIDKPTGLQIRRGDGTDIWTYNGVIALPTGNESNISFEIEDPSPLSYGTIYTLEAGGYSGADSHLKDINISAKAIKR